VGEAIEVSGPKITKKDTGNRGAEGAEGRGVWGGVSGGGSACPSQEIFLILYLKMATFSAFWALFCTARFPGKSSALGFKNCCCVHTKSKRRQSMPGEKL